MSRPIIFYNPRGEGHLLPLGLVHVASMASANPVVIIDGRVELAPEARVVELSDEALCLGVSVPTGAPILDALRVSRAVRARSPRLPVIWGGWHASLMPEQCLASGAVDACVVGQGERTMAAVLEALLEGRSFEGIPGVVWQRDGELVRNPERSFEDMNGFSAANFGLLDMERYFRFRGARRLDYCSSQGESADSPGPQVYGKGWFGLEAGRVVAELKHHVGRYRLDEVFFNDDNFFHDLRRTEAIGRGLIEAGVRMRWFGTGRADILCRSTDEQLRLIRASGCHRVNVTLSGASPASAGETRSPSLALEVLETAEKLHRAGIGARFSFTAGFPKEGKGSLAQTYRLAKAIREIDGAFETPIYFYVPYPGTARADMQALGFNAPGRLEEWEGVDLDHSIGPWISESVRRVVPRYNFYLRHGYQKPGPRPGQRLLHYVARVRAKANFYNFDFERRAVELAKRLRTGRNPQQPPLAED